MHLTFLPFDGPLQQYVASSSAMRGIEPQATNRPLGSSSADASRAS